MNRIRISGRITKDVEFSHEICDEKFYVTEIECQRTSLAYDTVKVIVPEIFVQDFKPGNCIEISGEVRTVNKDGHCLVHVFVRDIYEYSGKDVNNVEIVDGVICREPSYRTTPLGRKITDVLIASNRQYGKADYLPCIAWGRFAVKTAGMDVGTTVACSGRLQSREYTKRYEDGTEEYRTAYEISISKIKEEDESAKG